MLIFKSFGSMLESRITGLNGYSIPSFLKNFETAFHTSCTNLQSTSNVCTYLSPNVLINIYCYLYS